MKGSLGTSASLKGNNHSPRVEALIALKQAWRIVKSKSSSKNSKSQSRLAISRLDKKLKAIGSHKTEAEFRQEKEDYIQRMKMM